MRKSDFIFIVFALAFFILISYPYVGTDLGYEQIAPSINNDPDADSTLDGEMEYQIPEYDFGDENRDNKGNSLDEMINEALSDSVMDIDKGDSASTNSEGGGEEAVGVEDTSILDSIRDEGDKNFKEFLKITSRDGGEVTISIPEGYQVEQGNLNEVIILRRDISGLLILIPLTDIMDQEDKPLSPFRPID